MRTIWKYKIPTKEAFFLEFSERHEIKHFGLDPQGTLCLWVETYVDANGYLSKPRKDRVFSIFGTGNPIPDGYCYVASAVSGDYMWHLYTIEEATNINEMRSQDNATPEINKSTEKRVPLYACPPGLFLYGKTLGFKSEYHTNRNLDAYVVASGEYFWGGTSDRNIRDTLMVRPVTEEELYSEYKHKPKAE